MAFPLGFDEISMLFGFFSILLTIASGLFSPYFGKVNVSFSRRRLRNVALGVSILFLVTIVIRVVGVMLSP